MKKKKIIISLLTFTGVLLSSCALARQKQELVWSKWYDNGDGTHSRHNINDISVSETDVHHFVLTSTLEEPTEVAPGKAIYTCEECACKEEKVVPPTGNYVFDQKVVDDKYLLEKYSEHSAAYYMSSVEGAFGDPRYVFEVSDVPTGYTEVDYVESDGRQWIDTGVKNNGKNQVNINNGSRLGMDYTELEYIESNGTQYLKTGVFGCAKWTITIQFTQFGTRMLMGYNGNGGNYWGVAEQSDYRGTEEGDYETYNAWAGHLKAGNKDVIVDDFGDSIEGQEVRYLNGTGVFGPRNISTDVSDVDYELLALDNGKAPCYAKLYSVKAEKKGVVVCDFVPARRNYDGEIGLYDLVTDKFIKNLGTGEFVYGPEVNKRNSNLPSEYQELEYIESTGTQQIDLNTSLDLENGSFEIDFLSTAIDQNGMIIGHFFGDYHAKYIWLYHYSLENQLTIYLNGDTANQQNLGYVNPDLEKHNAKYRNKSFILDDIQKGTAIGTLDITENLYLFSGGGGYNYIGKIFNLKIDNGEGLVRNLVPCYRISDGVTGMYDLVSGQLFTNEGTGEFIRGREIGSSRQLPKEYQEVEFIQSEGLAYAVIPDLANFDSWEIDVQFISNEVEYCVLGNLIDPSHGWELYTGEPKDTYCLYTTGEGSIVSTYSAFDRSKISYSYTTNKAKINDVEIGERNLVTQPKYLLAYRNGNYIAKAKLYGFSVYFEGNEVLHLVPCYRINDGTIGLYDTVSNVFLTNAGTGTFIKGADVQDGKSYLPVEYQQVEYVKSDGNQWINANVVFSTGDTAAQIIDVQFLDTSMRWCGTNWYLQYGFDSKYVNTNERVIVRQQYENKNLKTFVNGSLITDETFDRSIPENIGTGVFRLGDSNGNWYETEYDSSHPSSQILYSLKIYKNNVLVRDFVPCYKKANEEVGLFDLVSASFFANEGTSPLSKGDDINVIDGSRDYNSQEKAGIPEYYYQLNYIESTGLQGLDTGVVGGAKIDTTIKFFKNSSIQIMGYGDTDGHYFGVGPDNNYIGTTIEAGNIDNVSVDISNTTENKATLKINDESPVNFDIPNLGTETLKFFSVGTLAFNCLALMYSAKVYQGETLVRDYIPVMQKQTGAVGLYDLVNQRFYESNTTYKFESGGIMYGGIDTSNINVFCNLASNKSHPYSSKISSYKVYEGREVVRDFVSVIRNNDGVAGLYDLKNNQFYTSNSEFPLSYGNIIGHKLDEGTLIRKATYNMEGEIVYKCIYTNEEIHLSTECTAYKVTFVSNNANLTAVKIFNEVDPNNFEMSMIGYTRNSNTYNYSKSGAYIFFEIPDDGNEYTVETTSGRVNKVKGQPRQFKITGIKGDVFIQLKVK